MKSIKNISIIILLITLVSCVKEVPNASNYEPQVFISGFLLDGSNYVNVRIQRTVPVDVTSSEYIPNAQIAIYTKNSNGENTLLTDDFNYFNRTYRSNNMVVATVGNTYWMEIELEDGTTYTSDEEILKEEIIIKDVEITNDYNRVIFSDPVDDTNFYLINYRFYKNGRLALEVNNLTNDVLFNGNDNATFDSTEFFIDNPDEVRVTIANLNFSTYQFYFNQFEQLESQITNSGSEDDPSQLFWPPPANLTGNIINTSDNTKALGFFGVQSSSEFIKSF
ncbi:hypothetical protein [uncultured Maribacter sp.]|uniref:hypothetical protein n=1 Tax=uncultured Maribacter sp. TaxID=431308 RepID=UPI002635C7E8|nr:hypothetical protein [uncultured Maribacter sp.]